MDDRRFGAPARTAGLGATRRRMVTGAAGAGLAILGLDLTGGAVAAGQASPPVGNGHDPDPGPDPNLDLDLEQAIERVRAATAEFIEGKPAAWKAMCSHAADATLFGGCGGHERGWEQLGPRYDWAAARYAGGEVTFEEIARVATAGSDLAYTVHIERMRARLAGREETVPVALRDTHVYRREDGGWKLGHRHADPIVSVQAPESVVDR